MVALTSIAILKVLQSPMKDTDVAIALDVSLAQAKTWLHRLVDAGVLEKCSKPVAYAIKPTGLFSSIQRLLDGGKRSTSRIPPTPPNALPVAENAP